MHLVSCGSGDPILFIHGMPTNSRLWSGVTDRLRERYTCLAVDLPGLGKTPHMQYGPDYLRRVAEHVDALRIENGIEKWHVVGHDAGAAVAVHYAHFFQKRVHHLALLSPSVFPELRPYFLLEPLRKPVLGEVLAPLIHLIFWRIAMHRALAGKKDRDEILRDFCAPFSGLRGPWQFMRAMRWGKPSRLLEDVPGFLPQLLMPTLIFHGSRDAAIHEGFAQRAHSLIPNSRLLTLDSGHFIPLHKPEVVATWLAKFFGNCRPESGRGCGDGAMAGREPRPEVSW